MGLLERSENFLQEASSLGRERSHGCVRCKTHYHFLSISRIFKDNEEFRLMIFLPQINKCLNFQWSKEDGVKKLEYPPEITRPEALYLVEKAIEENRDRLPIVGNISKEKWKGVYLLRVREGANVGKDGLETFKKAFGGKIPHNFIEECKAARITMERRPRKNKKTPGKKKQVNPFKFTVEPLENVLARKQI